MQGLFGIDTPFYKFTLRVVQIFYLTILWFIFSLPIITIGASTTALYYVSLKMAKNEDGYITKQFLHSFKQNFRQATSIWLIILIVGIILGVNNFYYWIFQEKGSMLLRISFAILAVLYYIVTSFVFPSLAKFDNTIKKTFVFSAIMSIRNFGWVLMMVAINLLIWIAVFMLNGLPLFIATGLNAFLQAFIFNMIFDKFIEKNELLNQTPII